MGLKENYNIILNTFRKKITVKVHRAQISYYKRSC